MWFQSPIQVFAIPDIGDKTGGSCSVSLYRKCSKTMISAATYRDYNAIIELWERSVRATHHFLPEDYLQEIKALLPGILPHVKLYVWREDNKFIRGFAGVAQQKIEMLFIHPDSIGRGLGRQFTMFCVHALNVDKCDVNEQNEKAVLFYKKMGYQTIARDERDSLGRLFPILRMQYCRSC
jgi:ribosomal protein S18 acetylase RimI-like enzyme